MTAQEMSQTILETVARHKRGAGISVYELVDACGAEAKGDRSLEFRKNLLLWNGVSETFSEAFWMAYPRLRVEPLPEELTGSGAKWLPLPVATRVREYKRPHWLTVAVSLRGDVPPSWQAGSPAPRPERLQRERVPDAENQKSEAKLITCPQCKAKFDSTLGVRHI